MTSPRAADPFPIHGQMSSLTRAIELSSIVVALGLLAWHEDPAHE